MPEFADAALWWLVVKALAVGVLLLLLGGLVLRVMRVPAASAVRHMAPATAERWFLQLALGLSGVGWCAVLLAELGRFTLGWLLGLLVAACVGLRLMCGPAGRRDASRGGGSTDILAMGALCLLAVCLYVPPYQTALWASDSTAYLNFGRQISETGGSSSKTLSWRVSNRIRVERSFSTPRCQMSRVPTRGSPVVSLSRTSPTRG
jgi:hypothetical protein